MRHRLLLAVGLGAAVAAGVACASDVDVGDSSSDAVSGSSASSSGAGGVGGVGGTGGAGAAGSTSSTAISSSTGGGTTPCNSGPNQDQDGDGWTGLEGDCNDCDPHINPGAVEVIVTRPDADGGIPIPLDEDCDGIVDNVDLNCDGAIAVGDTDPFSAVKAIDLCRVVPSAGKDWGVISAAYVGAAGGARQPGLQTGLLDGFGANVLVQRGARMLALSSGHARDMISAQGCGGPSCNMGTDGPAPAGYPQDHPTCDGASDIHDDIALEVTIRAPTNVEGFSYLYKLHSFAFPEQVCTPKNDQFAVLMTPAPLGSINGNIAFDTKGNPLSINVATFDVCDPASISDYAKLCALGANCPAPPFPYCEAGAGDLAGTGFAEWGDGAATGWLKNLAPVEKGGVFTLRFAIWDTGDHDQDSTVLLDDFAWIIQGPGIGTPPVDPG